MATNLDLIALGGALDRKGVKPPIGGSSYVLKISSGGRVIALVVDYGAYPLPEEARKLQTDLILSLEEQAVKYVSIGGLDFPLLDFDSNIFEALDDNDVLSERVEEFVPAHEVLADADEIWIIATHGHVDHAGAIPYLDKRYPGRVRVLMTAATQAICEWSWHDSLKIAYGKGHKLFYGASDVDSLLERTHVIAAGSSVEIGSSTLTFFPAGHISGAVSVLVRSPCSPTVFFTGDMSITDQRTVKGALLPDCSVDYLISESTYGARTSARGRAQVEEKIAEEYLLQLRSGGRVLCPTLAVGRSRELFAILKAYGVTDEFPVYVDGAACKVALACAKLDGTDLEIERHCITTRALRRHVMRSGEPSVVIVPSGMLAGGHALGYLREWGTDPHTLVALSCYQHECSPGYRLLRVPQGGRVRMRNGGDSFSTFQLNARVAQYALSAHMDQKDILGVIERLKPKGTFLVHGEEDSMDAIINASSSLAYKTYINEPIRLA